MGTPPAPLRSCRGVPAGHSGSPSALSPHPNRPRPLPVSLSQQRKTSLDGNCGRVVTATLLLQDFTRIPAFGLKKTRSPRSALRRHRRGWGLGRGSEGWGDPNNAVPGHPKNAVPCHPNLAVPGSSQPRRPVVTPKTLSRVTPTSLSRGCPGSSQPRCPVVTPTSPSRGHPNLSDPGIPVGSRLWGHGDSLEGAARGWRGGVTPPWRHWDSARCQLWLCHPSSAGPWQDAGLP